MFSFVFLSFIDLKKKEFLKVVIAGIVVSLIWGLYYNVFPVLYGYAPFGISLGGLTFLGMGIVGTGIAFGVVHTLAFMFGFYVNKFVMGKIVK